jgi:HEAT repeat protein
LIQTTSPESQNQAVKALAALLSHVEPAVLPDVVACLGECGEQARAALPVLDKLLDDSEPSTRASAAMAILAIDDKPTPRLLAALVDLLSIKSLPQGLRMDALGRIKEADPAALRKATPALICQLGDQSADVRRAAIELLSAIIEDAPAEMPVTHGGK